MYNEHGFSYYMSKANDLDGSKFEKKIPVALLSSFTINGSEETLRVKSAEKNIDSYTEFLQHIHD